MSSLSTTRKEYVLEQLMLSYIKKGIIPTSDQLEEDLNKYQNTYLDLNRPKCIYKNWDIETGGESSASSISDVIDTFSDDSCVVSKEIYRLAAANSSLYDRWIMEIKRLAAYAAKLEQRVDSLLLVNSDTAGYFNCVSDTFSDLSKVDTDYTTANIDTESGIATINPIVSESNLNGSVINLSKIIEDDISFNVITRTPGTFYSTIGNCSLINIFKSNNDIWIGKVSSKSSGNMVCELKARVSTAKINVSKISIQFSGQLGCSSSSVTCMYSSDGYSWNTVPSANPSKSVSNNTSWVFKPVSISWIKFIITKQSPDSDGSYIYSISSVRLYGDSYSSETESIVMSTALSTLDTSKNPVLFASAALETCEDVLNNTGIDYWLSASIDNESWTNWTQVVPAASTSVSYPKVVNFNGLGYKTNESLSDVLVLNELLSSDSSQQKITTSFSSSVLGSNLLGYKFKNANYGAINTAITLNDTNEIDTISKCISVWRNTRLRDSSEFPDTSLVRKTLRGWGFDGNQYSCYFEVLSSAGKMFDFGSTKCIIDGKQYTGSTTIPQGIHKFLTDASNWLDISDNYNALSTTPISEEGLKSIDSLYPYNHKLLIEGYPYPSGDGFGGAKVYSGVDISAEYYMSAISLFDLENNYQNDYSRFAIRSVGNETYPTLAIIVRFDVGNTDYSNELFCIKWKSSTSGSSLYKYVKMKASLWTNQNDITPVLLSYRIKLGV